MNDLSGHLEFDDYCHQQMERMQVSVHIMFQLSWNVSEEIGVLMRSKKAFIEKIINLMCSSTRDTYL
jgi:hypothetical protein